MQAPASTNERIYRVSPPSIGSALVTYPVEGLTFANGMFSRKLSANEINAARLEKGQPVLLYDKSGTLLVAMGEITALGENLGDTDREKTLVIGFTQPGTTPEFAVDRGEIVTGRKSDLTRLPETAIMRDGAESRVWEVREEPSGRQRAHLVPVNIVRSGQDHVVVALAPESSNLFILNPDRHLREGQAVSTEKILYSGPSSTPDYGIRKRLDAIRDEYEQIALANIAREQRLASAGASGGACPILPGESQRFMDSVMMRNSAPIFNPPNMSLPGSKPAQ